MRLRKVYALVIIRLQYITIVAKTRGVLVHGLVGKVVMIRKVNSARCIKRYFARPFKRRTIEFRLMMGVHVPLYCYRRNLAVIYREIVVAIRATV